MLESAAGDTTDWGKMATRLTTEPRQQLLRWYGGNIVERSSTQVERALALFFWCAKHSDIDFLPAEMRDRILDQATSQFGLSRDRLCQLLVRQPLEINATKQTIFIAFEGIDGAGKTRHLTMLEDDLRKGGKAVKSFSFPAYDEFFGRELGKILSGNHALGASRLDPRSMALWYALDRWNILKSCNFNDYDVVLFNRFTLSSAVYQSVRAPAKERDEMSTWIFELEHGQLGLPVPNTYIVLDVSPSTSQKNVLRKGHRNYSGKKLDLYERSIDLLSAARERYLYFSSKLPNLRVVQCMKSSTKMKSMEEVHKEILDCLNACGVLATIP
ncbi:MAG TPA: thymidylate kinase [Candidatus Angelobacter sp.]|nr:thymidylate kinase [Candidatus Angelobacter sp.]